MEVIESGVVISRVEEAETETPLVEDPEDTTDRALDRAAVVVPQAWGLEAGALVEVAVVPVVVEADGADSWPRLHKEIIRSRE